MAQVLVHPLPMSLLKSARIDPSSAHHAQHNRCCYGPDGTLHVLTRISSPRPGACYITVYDSEGSLLRIVDLEKVQARVDLCGSHLTGLCVTPEGHLVVLAENNMAFVYSADGERLLARYDRFYGGTSKSPLTLVENLGFELVGDPEGGLLCATAILSSGHLNPIHNMVIGVSRGGQEFRFDFINQYETRLPLAQELIFPHILQGNEAHNTRQHASRPALKDQLARTVFGGRAIVREAYFLSHIRLTALGGSRFVLPVYYLGVSQLKHSEVTFMIVSYDGEMLGHLRGIAENPAVNEQGEVVYDPRFERIAYKSDQALYFFNRDGRQLGALPLKQLAPCRKLLLRACSSEGRLVLLDPQNHLSLVLDPIPTLDKAQAIVSDGLKALRKQLREKAPWTTALAPTVAPLEAVQHPPAGWSLT